MNQPLLPLPGDLQAAFIPALDTRATHTLIALHGLGDSLEGYRWLPSALGLSKLNYLLVNAPDPYYGGFSWYDLYEDPDSGVRRSRTLLTGLLQHLEGKGVKAESTILFGFSQGCLMTLDVGLRYPRRLAGLVGISGYVHQPSELLKELGPAAKTQPTLVTHGTRDPLIPFARVRSQMFQLRDAGIPLVWKEFEKEHTIAGEEELSVIREFIVSCMSPSSGV